MTSFGVANYITLGLYLAGTFFLGIWFARRNKTTTDYFQANHSIPWWVMGISLSNVSSISYMSIPAKAFAGNWSIFFVNLPILLLAPIVIYLFLPVFARLSSASAYGYLEDRFGLGARLYGAAAFVLFQIGRMALVLYLPALALSAVTDINIFVCILLIGVLSAVYSTMGGVQAVVWTDFAQTVFLVGAAVLAFLVVIWRLEGGFGELTSVATQHDKLQMIQWSGDYTTGALWVILLGSIFAQLVPYISDQSIIQRYMTTTDVRACGRGIWTNAILAMINTVLFLSVGTAIFVYYQLKPQGLAGLPKPDAILPFFVAREMPPGVAGLVVAGIFAAAQSAISTSLNSSSTVLVTDFLQRFSVKRPDEYWLSIAKWLTGIMGVVGISLAGVLALTRVEAAFDFFQRILGLTASGLAGLFILGIFTRRANSRGALTGAIVSAILLCLIQAYTRIHFYLYALIGIVVCVLVGYAVSLFFPPPPARRPSPPIS